MPGIDAPLELEEKLMLRLVVVSLAAILTLSTAQAAKMYKWVDERGVTHFSTRPPPAEDADQTTLKGGSVLRKPKTDSDGLAKIDRVNLGGADWDGCDSRLCRLVRQLDPSCETSYCGRAKSLSSNCTSASCQTKKLVLETDVRNRIAEKDALRQQQAINANQAPTPPAPQSQD